MTLLDNQYFFLQRIDVNLPMDCAIHYFIKVWIIKLITMDNRINVEGHIGIIMEGNFAIQGFDIPYMIRANGKNKGE